ncbi:ammonium transporter [Aquihabitans sp. G128]|uniref:ammonium transporter n=1 Tax=Aquihabitans sp. G128 TaxID=2849779 RepID=UPI001C23A2A1|nr:ammonium transporter [Aquihabitans sp. G128]QXC63057.1 ammonium transporter [Aquihabitans sp. G128]
MNMLRLPWSGSEAATPALAGVGSGGSPSFSDGTPPAQTFRGRQRLPISSFKERETQKRFGVLLAGKVIGIAGVFGVMALFTYFFSTAAGATPAQAATKAENLISPINTMWVLVAAFLVFFMQAGFMALEAGFARSRESVNIMMECIFDTCMCGVLYYAVGFAFQFGANFHGVIGKSYFFLQDIPKTYDYAGLFDTKVAFLAFFLFQFAFADTASTITSGAMVGRTSFKGDILYSLGVSGLIYPIFAHWVWGPGGWLGNTMGWFHGLVPEGVVFRDFAGSTVVHTVGAMLALMGALALGPRLGRKFAKDGGGPTAPHDMNIAAIGAVILWFGWYGFNPGSTLSAMDFEGIGRVAANTTLAACAGGLVAVFFVYPRSKKWDVGMAINGFLGGLVAITAPCYWVSPTGALIIGAVSGIIVPLVVDLLESLRIDDPIGAVAVHGGCGVWGTLCIGLFATGSYGLPDPNGTSAPAVAIKGLFYGGGGSQLLAQAIGSLSCIVVVGAVGGALMFAIRKLPGAWNLRIANDEELEGIDIVEHGLPAYHMEFGAGFAYTTYTGKSVAESSSSVTGPAGPEAENVETEKV